MKTALTYLLAVYNIQLVCIVSALVAVQIFYVPVRTSTTETPHFRRTPHTLIFILNCHIFLTFCRSNRSGSVVIYLLLHMKWQASSSVLQAYNISFVSAFATNYKPFSSYILIYIFFLPLLLLQFLSLTCLYLTTFTT